MKNLKDSEDFYLDAKAIHHLALAVMCVPDSLGGAQKQY
jgi:hypothetical protein